MSLWGGRFTEPTDRDLQKLNDSIGFDQRMAIEDIAGSMAYARELAWSKVISSDEMEALLDGLEQVRQEFIQGKLEFHPSDEDIHTAVERRLTEIVGAVGGKLHTGRSRNDQVATDFRLWTVNALKELDDLISALAAALVEVSETHIETVMPGYTHLQPAQPITAAHWLLSFFWMLTRDRERLRDAARRTSVSPLGSGALAGHPFGIDRERLAETLGFAGVSQNSLDAVSDRDFAAEFAFCMALLGVHLSRLAEDVILYSNPAFGFITLNDRYSTGSSLMPQKRNADPMELARGKSGRLIGNLTGLLTTLKGLPSGYNKDLQEDKESVFDSFDNLKSLLPVITAVIRTLQLNPEAMTKALQIEMLATDLAEYLVRKGMPFREAHHVSGRAVRLASERGVTMADLSLTDYQALSDLFSEDVFETFDYLASVNARNSLGGTAVEAVKKQIQTAKATL